ncbi:MAG: DUF362 domain-containing protein [Candidatus Lokiarchaeota archaeon]|nr:DUF362 domain-containing protein [Candidatus Lokiarchaeota archaeon]
MVKVKVLVRDINSNPDDEGYLNGIQSAVEEIFDTLGGSELLKSSNDVYIKPNGIDSKPYAYTRPEVVEAVIKYFFSNGANKIYLMENSTQANYTRIVYEAIGYKKICKETGAIPVYLDEQKAETLEFEGKDRSSHDPNGYDKKTFEMPKIVVNKLIRGKNENLYINLPKLKTHSMGVVTLGIKNQWGFPMHYARKFDHNFNLHHKLVDVLSHIQPDVTLIEGIEGTIHGHYPLVSQHEKVIIPFRVMIASRNVVATDMVGAQVFGIPYEEVPAIKIAIEEGLSGGVYGSEDLEIDGDLSRFTERYDFDIIQEFPPNVNIVKGSELLCREGCLNNPLMSLQILHQDYGGRGKCDLVIGKGHNLDIIDNLEGPVVIAGHCAIEEVGNRLVQRLGKKHVFLSDGCNNLSQTIIGLGRYMGVNLLKLVPLSPIKSIILLIQAKLHGSHSNVPSLLSMLKPYKVKY